MGLRLASMALMVDDCIQKLNAEVNRVYPPGAAVTFRYKYEGEVFVANAVVSKHQHPPGEMPSGGLLVEVQEPELTRFKATLFFGCAVSLAWDMIELVQVPGEQR